MSTFLSNLQKTLRSVGIVMMCGMAISLSAQQLPNANFEDWSGPAFDGNAQPANWNVSNVTQLGFKFNFAHKEGGHNGGTALMVQNQDMVALGINGGTSPGYVALGQPWVFIKDLFSVGTATAGTAGGVVWKFRPDSLSVWVKRTGPKVDQEDFYLLYYAWSGTAKGSKYKSKDGGCSEVSYTNEESDIRQALDGNECGTDQKANQIAEGMWRQTAQYDQWTNIRVPIYYFGNDVPEMMNIIFSAGNYPNFRATTGVYNGNSLYIDDVELIYSAAIQKIYIDDKEWKGFDPNSSEEQVYSLGRNATSLPKIEARRGAGALTNARGTTATFAGRVLSGKEISIQNGTIDGAPTVITVRSEDGKSTRTYKIKFVREASKNPKLANIMVNGQGIDNFSPNNYNYSVALPYGTTSKPVVTVEKQEDEQTVEITQANSTNGKATIRVTAADKTTTATYTLQFSVAQLADNTLQDILVDDNSVPGFVPTQTIYRVSLPVSTTTMPTVKAVSAYPAGAQTIKYTEPAQIDGGTYQISVTTPGNAVPKVYKLNFKLEPSSYSYLKDLQMEGGYIRDFQPEVLTYYVHLPLGTTALPKITYVQGDEYQKVEIKEGGLDGTTRVVVTAANGDQTTYKIVVTTEKSEISTLKGIRINGVDLEGFSPDKTDYTYTLPVGTTQMPTIEPIKGDEFQQVSIIEGGINGTTRISVKAGNGNETIYQITFSVIQATDATLKMIYLDGVELPGYNKNQLEYTISLPQGTTKQPVVTYTPNDEYQTITVRSGSGVEDDYRITVRPQSGPSQTYILHFRVETSSNTTLKMLYVDNQPLADFSPEKTDYEYALPEGVSIVPSVSFDKAEPSQRVLSILDGNVQTITVTAENGEKRVYTITFIIQKSENAFLKMIYLDGEPLPNFESTTLSYTLPLKGALCPVITVEKEPGQQVTIAAPYATGQALIRVTPESGAANTYTILFTAAPVASVQLHNIFLDGKPLADFDPTKTEYTIPFEGALPEVTYDAEEGLSVHVLRDKNNIVLYVRNATDHVTYILHFQETVLADATLHSILLDGAPLSDFSPETTDYIVELEAGEKLPVVTCRKAYDAQVVYMGQSAENQTKIIVVAPSGQQTIYTITFRPAKRDDATLENLEVVGHDLAFEPTKTDYTLSIDEGAILPQVRYTTRRGQNVLLSETTPDQQQIIVRAESGASMTYTISYERVLSTNALLSKIIIGGNELTDFDPQTFDYTYTLPWRTQVVPNVFAVGQLTNQTITTYFSQVNRTTRIVVVAADGKTTNEYTIAFPVQKSANTALEAVYLNSETVSLDFNPEQTDYEVVLPYQTKEAPAIIYTKAEPEQTIRFISRPIRQTSEIIVTAENGDTRTYSILFRDSMPETDNILKSIHITETDEDLDIHGSAFTVNLPYGARTMTIDYEKAYPEQTVWVQNGGILQPTIITVRANRPEVADKVYTLTPKVATQDPAVLKSISISGTPLSDFDPNRFSYVVNVENLGEKSPIVDYDMPNGVKVVVTRTDAKCWEAKVSAQGHENTYTLWFYYASDIIPNGEFEEWENAAKHGVKPVGWNTLGQFADKYEYKPLLVTYTFTPGEEVKQDGTNDVAYLHTHYNTAPLAGYIPGYTTLGTIHYEYGKMGSSAFSVTDGIVFRNTPDTLKTSIKATKIHNNNRIVYQVTGSLSTQELVYENTTTHSDFETITMPLTDMYTQAGVPSQMNIILNSSFTENGRNGTEGGEGEMYVDWVRISYNSHLSALSANGVPATLNGNAFSVTLEDPEQTAIPQLSFTGEVSDQARAIVWSNETISEDGNYAIRHADITNYAEDGTSTAYTIEVRRPRESRNTLLNLYVDGQPFNAFTPDKTDYTIHMQSTDFRLPDLQAIPQSSLQTIKTEYQDNTYTITVTPEVGESKVYTLRFQTNLSAEVALASISDVPTFDPEQTDYTIQAETLPMVTFAKALDGQTVDYQWTAEACTILVTAEDGSQRTYKVTLDRPILTTTGQLAELEFDGNVYADFATDKYDYTAPRPNHVAFTRSHPTDSVIFVQDNEQMQWQVIGTEQHTYTLTYPVELSSNTRLAGILLNGKPYADFSPAVYNYTLLTDTFINIEVEKAETDQVVSIAFADATCTIDVQAADGTQGQPYLIHLQPMRSDDHTLAGILLDDQPIDNFDPTTLQYTVTIPVGEVKYAEPQQPSVTYLAAHPAQQIELTPGALGETTYITVTSEDGKQVQEYTVLVQAEPSHNADLTAIIVNGEPVDRFEPGRHFYSASVPNGEPIITWTADDNFQTVTVSQNDTRKEEYLIHVVAQDGTTTNDYTLEIHAGTLSNDVRLANIQLNGMPFDEFERELNPKLYFSPMQQTYLINLPSGTTILPEVSAVLNAEGQTVNISTDGMTIYLDVKAQDGLSSNRYTLEFAVPLSANTQLDMIFLNGNPLPDFVGSNFVYQVVLPVGVHTLPEVVGQKAESGQQIVETKVDIEARKATIQVLAEDERNTATYTILFAFTLSAEDTLPMIYADNTPIENYDPKNFYYTITLPIGTTDFPELSWDAADEWQKITIDTLEQTDSRIVRQIHVKAENGFNNTYTFAHTIAKSDVNTLQMIYVNNQPIADFEPTTNEYRYTLPADAAELPTIYPLPGDNYQTVEMTEKDEDLLSNTFGKKVEITVTAANGAVRTYTIRFPRQASSNALLEMIYLDSKPLSVFDPEQFTYRIDMPIDAQAIPFVSADKQEDMQQIAIEKDQDTVRIHVTAEDQSKQVYTLIFLRVKSSNANLQGINLADEPLVGFDPLHYDYTITLPYGTTELPAIQAIKAEEEQTIDISEPVVLPTGEQIITLTITAPNGLDQCAYTLTFIVAKNNDATLREIRICDTPIEGFRADSLEYVLTYEAGTDTTDLITLDDVHYTLSDPQAKAEATIQTDATILIAVTAQDGTMLTYLIRQVILKDTDNLLSMIYLDEAELPDFDPEQDFYTYFIVEGMTAPKVIADAFSDKAEVSIKEVAVGDTCLIFCTAESGDTRKYSIWFAASPINDALTPQATDVLVKRIAGSTQILVATTRKNVVFALYNTEGKLVEQRKLEPADPNDAVVINNANGQEQLVDITNFRSGQVFTLDPSQIYFYTFFEGGKKRIASGKIAVVL